MPRNRPGSRAQRGAVTAEVAVALPSLVLLLALLVGAVTAGLTQLRLEEAARAGAREVVRGEPAERVQATVRRIAGTHAHLKVSGDGDWSTVTVSARLEAPLLNQVGWDLSASASARAELIGPAQPLLPAVSLAGGGLRPAEMLGPAEVRAPVGAAG